MELGSDSFGYWRDRVGVVLFELKFRGWTEVGYEQKVANRLDEGWKQTDGRGIGFKLFEIEQVVLSKCYHYNFHALY
jgi:hypothetical protein